MHNRLDGIVLAPRRDATVDATSFSTCLDLTDRDHVPNLRIDTQQKGVHTVNTIANVANIAGYQPTNEASSNANRNAQNAFLSELPGVAFAFFTLVYGVTSLPALA